MIDFSSNKGAVCRPQATRIGAIGAQGMSMIEVLVSVMVLGVGLLGIAAMQSIALRGGQGSLESSQAVMASNSTIEAMRANRANASAYVYDGTTYCGSTPAAVSYTLLDVYKRQDLIRAAHPGACSMSGPRD